MKSNWVDLRIPTIVLNFPFVVASLSTFVVNFPLVVARLGTFCYKLKYHLVAELA